MTNPTTNDEWDDSPIEGPAITPAAWSEQLELSQQAYEHTAVRKVMTYYKLGQAFNDLSRRLKREWERPVGFADFRQEYPGFPVHFAVTHMYGIHNLALACLFKRFTKTPVYEAFLEAKPDADGRSFAMVFAWPQISKWMTLHNHVRDLSIPHPVFIRPTGHDNELAVLEPLDTFLQGVYWEP